MQVRIKGLVLKKGRYYWQPNAPERAAGWTPIGFGRDIEAAMKGATARNDEIDQWRTGGAKPRVVKAFIARASLAQLVERFKKDYLPRLAASTQALYRHNLDKLEAAWGGHEPVAAITPKRVRVLRDLMMRPKDGVVRHTMAFNVLTTGRALMKFGIELDLIEKNPFDAHGLGAPPPRDQVWSAPARAAIAAAAARPVTIDGGSWTEDHPAETGIGLAVMLGFTIAQREADLLKVPIVHYQPIDEAKFLDAPEVYRQLAALAPDGVVRGVRVRQGKTRRWVEVPVIGAVREAVEASIARARKAGLTTILFDDRTMQPWSGRAGQQRFQERFARLRARAAAEAVAAGDPDLAAELAAIRFQDLRRTAVVYHGELGTADQLIAAITGHALDITRKILETYMPRTTAMAGRAIALSAARDARAGREQEQRAGATGS